MTRDDHDEDHIQMRPLLRIGAWGVCAAVALGTAVFAARTEVGEQRVGMALAALRMSPAQLTVRPENVLATRPATPDNDALALGETVRSLAADRDRLANRVAALERILDETGSVARDPARAPKAATPAAPPAAQPDDKADAAPASGAAIVLPPQSSMPSASDVPPLSPEQPTIGMKVNVPLPRPGPLAQIQSYVSSATATTAPAEPEIQVAEAPAAAADAKVDADPAPASASKQLAVDLAAATNVNALRARWGTIKGAHTALLEGLRPLVSVRESARPGFTEFHLVAGPLIDVAAADRLCAALIAARAACKPALFDGQRLDLR
jgi:hypothetical protein